MGKWRRASRARCALGCAACGETAGGLSIVRIGTEHVAVCDECLPRHERMAEEAEAAQGVIRDGE